MPLNEGLEGKVYPEVTFVVDPDRVTLFRRALGERRDLAPPTLASAAEFAVLPAIIADPELGLDFARVVHSEQEYEWRRPFRPGETFTVRSRITSIRQKAGNGFLTIETELVDAVGEPIVVGRATMVERGA